MTTDPVRLFFNVSTLEAASTAPVAGDDGARLVYRTAAPVEIPAGAVLRDFEVRTGTGDLLGKVRFSDSAQHLAWEHRAAYLEGVAEGRRRERRRIRKRLRKVAGL